MSALDPAGEKCGNCLRTEQQCAYSWPCCDRCHHWPYLDANGDNVEQRGKHRRRAPAEPWMRREEAPCRRLPTPVNGLGPSVYLMQLEAEQRRHEGQRMLFNGDFDRSAAGGSGVGPGQEATA